MGLFENIFKWKRRDDEPEYEIEDWNEIVYDRDDLQINDKKQRKEYVQGCLEQIAEASKELEELEFEYNMVTSYLKDMEEIEALPEEEREILCECAKKIDALEEQQSGFRERKNRLDDGKFRQMQRLEEEVQEGLEKLTEAEHYQDLIKRDLRRLDGEKQAYTFRKNELRHVIADTRSMTIVCSVAVIACILLLLLLQFTLQLDTKIGYLLAAGIGAVAITLIYIKHMDAKRELEQVENGISRIIRLQNTVKIRYVNNTHLLDYLYMKYDVSSAGELGKSWQRYQDEKEERHSYQQAERELDQYQKELLHTLRRYQVKDPMIWLHQTRAILDKKEMVEIRHELIQRRQVLRKQMDYNQEVAESARNEVKDIAATYPKYAQEILAMVERYDR